MKIEEVKTLPVKERFVYWIVEREQIRLDREAGKPKPWTDDAILQKYRFCNVVRKEDKVSQWLLDNWYLPNYNHKNMLLACTIARFINLPSSLEAIGFPKRWNAERIKRILGKIKLSGANVFNAAYIIPCSASKGTDKLEWVTDKVVTPLFAMRNKLDPSSMENTWKVLMGQYGFGSFLAGQVVSDLRWAVDYKGEERGYPRWADCKDWAPKGPGSVRGMNRLLERNIKTPIKQEDFVDLLGTEVMSLEDKLPHGLSVRMEAMDFQNCLCEFDKYERTLFEGRRPKALFRSEK